MSANDPRSPGASWVNSYLMSPDVQRTVDFYEKAFGFKASVCAKGEDEKTYHAELHYRDACIMVGLEGQCDDMPMVSPKTSGVASPICLCVYVDDVDAFFNHAVKQGAQVVFEPADMFWGDRACCVLDIDGYSWTFCKYLGEQHQHTGSCSHER